MRKYYQQRKKNLKWINWSRVLFIIQLNNRQIKILITGFRADPHIRTCSLTFAKEVFPPQPVAAAGAVGDSTAVTFEDSVPFSYSKCYSQSMSARIIFTQVHIIDITCDEIFCQTVRIHMPLSQSSLRSRQATETMNHQPEYFNNTTRTYIL